MISKDDNKVNHGSALVKTIIKFVHLFYLLPMILSERFLLNENKSRIANR